MINSALYLVLLVTFVVISNADFSVYDFLYRAEVCSMPNKFGDCKAASRMWYYHSAGKVCKEFMASVCGGNLNRFYSKIECEEYCE